MNVACVPCRSKVFSVQRMLSVEQHVHLLVKAQQPVQKKKRKLSQFRHHDLDVVVPKDATPGTKCDMGQGDKDDKRLGFGFRVSGFGFRISGFGFRV